MIVSYGPKHTCNNLRTVFFPIKYTSIERITPDLVSIITDHARSKMFVAVVKSPTIFSRFESYRECLMLAV